MKDEACIQFLQWALPQLQLRWQGFRRVRKQVCKRISRRIAELGLVDEMAYRNIYKVMSLNGKPYPHYATSQSHAFIAIRLFLIV